MNIICFVSVQKMEVHLKNLKEQPGSPEFFIVSRFSGPNWNRRKGTSKDGKQQFYIAYAPSLRKLVTEPMPRLQNTRFQFLPE